MKYATWNSLKSLFLFGNVNDEHKNLAGSDILVAPFEVHVLILMQWFIRLSAYTKTYNSNIMLSLFMSLFFNKKVSSFSLYFIFKGFFALNRCI
jgi:hypothetical protein